MNNKIFMSVNKCIPGMKIGEDIINQYGAIIVAENTVLNKFMIDKLSNLGIIKVRINHSELESTNFYKAQSFDKQYDENVDVLKEIIYDISVGKNINIEKVDIVTESVFSKVNENSDILNCMNQLRNTDDYNYTHSINVSLLVMMIGKWLKFDPVKLKLLIQTGLLHDIGKTKIPSEILNKPSSLTKEEYNEMKKHSLYGY